MKSLRQARPTFEGVAAARFYKNAKLVRRCQRRRRRTRLLLKRPYLRQYKPVYQGDRAAALLQSRACLESVRRLRFA